MIDDRFDHAVMLGVELPATDMGGLKESVTVWLKRREA